MRGRLGCDARIQAGRACRVLLAVLVTVSAGTAASGDEPPYFRIEVVDAETGRGVPLVELRTTHEVTYVTDSGGICAFFEPGLMNRQVYFAVSSPGYEIRPDGFGFRGVRLQTEPGGRATVRIERTNIAERLYRVTGAGIYRDTVLTGGMPPIEQPLLNADVLGSDSVMQALFGGRIYWFWGDTNRPSYPLGNFHVPGATSQLPGAGGLDPAVGVNLEYFVGEDGFARPTAQMPGEGPTWIDGLVVLRDEAGVERMFAAFMKVKPPLTVYQRGLVEFDAGPQQFRLLTPFDLEAPLFPRGHAFVDRDAGQEYVYFADPLPHVRVPARVSAYQDLAQYEGFTCVRARDTAGVVELDRGADGRLRYAWRRGSAPLSPEETRTLRQQGHLADDELPGRLVDRDTGEPVQVHRGTVAWNDYRQRWIMIFTQAFGRSHLGEVWFAEAQELTGPWIEATRIASHPQYSFYNPRHHPVFDQQGGRIIYFEGTYSRTFSGTSQGTPRYDYNQLMYRLDLSDRRLARPTDAVPGPGR